MKNHIKSIVILSSILTGGNYVCGMEKSPNVEPAIIKGRTIIATFNIDNDHVGEDVQIINDRETTKTGFRTDLEKIDVYKLGGDLIDTISPKNDGTIGKKYKFGSVGAYKLYYYFN